MQLVKRTYYTPLIPLVSLVISSTLEWSGVRKNNNNKSIRKKAGTITKSLLGQQQHMSFRQSVINV